MKCFVAVLAAVVLAIGSAQAAECTQAQLSASLNQDGLNKLQTACASSLSLASSSTAMVNPEGAAKKVCEDKPCLEAMKEVMEKQPDCSIQGKNFKTEYMSRFSLIQSSCKQLGVSVEPPTTAPASATSSAATSAVGMSAVIVAVGAIVALN